jgi:hypothetical protein
MLHHDHIRNSSTEQLPVATGMAEVAALMLANICVDVQIGICMCLHPSDILALRKVWPGHCRFVIQSVNIFKKTCKALQLSTRQRVVWLAALHRVCLNNVLFLPSFPISNMSDLELEKTAMAPTKWIELCGAFEKRHLNDPGAILRPRATRIINDNDTLIKTKFDIAETDFFIVPGGRYLVCSSLEGISVLDLGFSTSSGAESARFKLIASVGPIRGYKTCIVQATPDGMGLVLLSDA